MSAKYDFEKGRLAGLAEASRICMDCPECRRKILDRIEERRQMLLQTIYQENKEKWE